MTQDDRYSRGKIYKLVTDVSDQIYIGSCCVPLRKRLCAHKSCSNKTKSKELFNLGGKVEIILIEEYPCKSKMELERRERYHIENNDCINRTIPGRTKKEYYEDNRDAIIEYQKDWYAVNRDVLLEKQKEYNKTNREAISEKKKEYYEANQDVILEKLKVRVNCPHCQKELARGCLTRHIKRLHKDS